jgi:cytochrome c biogenesis protein CcmG/thiol:disulfide interchange protein DsbE|tara:strand:+ start:1067 stop:1624 length:558 start_codon:yes stop_codon:yes gene_type:complete
VLQRVLLILPLFIFLIAGAFFLWGLDPERDPSFIPSVMIDKPVPQFELAPVPGVDRPGLATPDLIDSPVTLVNVFASWCVPCRAEHAVLTRLVEEEGIRLVGINHKDEPVDVANWLDELGNPYERIGSDLDGRASVEWGLTGVPETFVVDTKGRIRYRQVGALTALDLDTKLRPVLQAAMAEGGS